MNEIVREGTTEFLVFKKNISRKGPGLKDKEPFYNPSMESNRDLSVVVNQWLINRSTRRLHLLDGLAASGVRGVRLANEVNGDFHVTVNDVDPKAFLLIKKNIELNRLKNAIACNRDLNVLLSEGRYDYIDIDPFGSPVGFIDSAVRSICNNGVIACTATDTASLCGVYPNVCLRRYGARPFHSPVMHEIGLRILIGFICREAAKYDKGIKPLLCYSTDHYFRLYVQVRKGKRFADESVKDFSTFNLKETLCFTEDVSVGPLWLGQIHDKATVGEIRTLLFEKRLNTKKQLWKLLYLLEDEADAPPFFYLTDYLASKLRISVPRMKCFFPKLEEKGYMVVRTHFASTGFKTDAPLDEIIEVFKKL
jgi:tRNA (guanine26-N2/guanine27-N2)-dimethyltransferase